MKSVHSTRTRSLAELGRLFLEEPTRRGLFHRDLMHPTSSSRRFDWTMEGFWKQTRGVIPCLYVTELLRSVSQKLTGRRLHCSPVSSSEPILLNGPLRIKMSFFCRWEAALERSKGGSQSTSATQPGFIGKPRKTESDQKMFEANVLKRPQLADTVDLLPKKPTGNQPATYQATHAPKVSQAVPNGDQQPST